MEAVNRGKYFFPYVPKQAGTVFGHFATLVIISGKSHLAKHLSWNQVKKFIPKFEGNTQNYQQLGNEFLRKVTEKTFIMSNLEMVQAMNDGETF